MMSYEKYKNRTTKVVLVRLAFRRRSKEHTKLSLQCDRSGGDNRRLYTIMSVAKFDTITYEETTQDRNGRRL